MPKTHDVDGVILNVINPMLGIGGQGHVEHVVLTSDPTTSLVLKHLPTSPEMQKRVKALINLALPSLSPYLAAPITMKVENGEVLHVAPFVVGEDLLSSNGTFPANMEKALLFAILTTILEENGIAHGDIAPSNIMIDKDGGVHLIDFDNFDLKDGHTPKPTMAGQHMMLAPEIRQNKNQPPNIKSDRFSFAIIYNLLLLRRHPADQATTPSELDDILTCGHWAERDKAVNADDVPIEALGQELPRLFDDAFALDPDIRPSADGWRQALTRALKSMVIHDCGNAFVHHHGQSICPWCQGNIEGERISSIKRLKITIPSSGARYGVDLQDGQTAVLGRSNLGQGAEKVSGKHLEITPSGNRIFLRHLGRNPTAILKNGKWYNLRETWISYDEMTEAPISFKLADMLIDIGM